MSRIVVVDAGPSAYVQNISVGPHRFQADEPSDSGGNDAGPNPYELLLAALGACTSMTVRMYAERRLWPLQGVQVRLAFSRIHAADCAECDVKKGMANGIEIDISFLGDLSDGQRERLMEIANNCPVHRTLVSEMRIHSVLRPGVSLGDVLQGSTARQVENRK